MAITRTPRIVNNSEAQECTHQDIYEVAQAQISEHHTQKSIEIYSDLAWQDELHRIARENGANQC